LQVKLQVEEVIGVAVERRRNLVAQIAEVKVDKKTGKVKVVRIACHRIWDCVLIRKGNHSDGRLYYHGLGYSLYRGKLFFEGGQDKGPEF